MSETKKLSEIGEKMWIEDSYNDDKEDAYLIAHTADSLLSCDDVRGAGVKVIVLDAIERRELVRQAWEMGMKQLCKICGDIWCGHIEDIVDLEDWMKEQGL